jgi:hypothetical protein
VTAKKNRGREDSADERTFCDSAQPRGSTAQGLPIMENNGNGDCLPGKKIEKTD